MPTYSLNLRKYLYLLEHLPPALDKLNLSYNLLLPQPLIDHVLYRVSDLKLTQRSCTCLARDMISQRPACIDPGFQAIAQEIVKQKGAVRVRRIQVHPKRWLQMRGEEGATTCERFWFNTDCMHEFVINMEYVRTQRLRKLLIKDFDINLVPVEVLNQLIIEIIEDGCLNDLEYFGLINVNL